MSIPSRDPDWVVAVGRALSGGARPIYSTVTGVSMVPTLLPGSQVRVVGGPPPAAAAGQLVLIPLEDGRLVVHRVVATPADRRARRFVVTRGDASILCDAPVPEGRVAGYVTAVRLPDGWAEVPSSPRRSLPWRWLAAVHRQAVIGALWLHPTLARSVVRLARRAHQLLRILKRSRP